MSRLVQPKITYVGGAPTRSPDGVTRSPDAGQTVDEYQDRVAKYIPGEVVGGYVSLDGILATPSTPELAAKTLPVAHADMIGLSAFMNVQGFVFLTCLILAPLYVWHCARRTGTTVWKAQALIATLAFIVWAYAIKGSVFFSNPALNEWAHQFGQDAFYNPKWAAALLVLFSLAVAFYQPKKTISGS